MMLDTTGELFPEGTYTFSVSDVPTQEDVKGYEAWRWTFDTETEEGPRTYSERFMVWLLAPLVRALGFEEGPPGKFPKFEATEALDRSVVATIKHVTLEKGASAGKVVARMTAIKSVNQRTAAEIPAAMNAQAPAGKASSEDIPF